MHKGQTYSACGILWYFVYIIGPSEVRAPVVGVAHAGGEHSGLY
jgi:hypothetical protein